jgi:hypothetical protein
MTESNRGTLIKVAVLGGTGKEGSGLAMRWALNGYLSGDRRLSQRGKGRTTLRRDER